METPTSRSGAPGVFSKDGLHFREVLSAKRWEHWLHLGSGALAFSGKGLLWVTKAISDQ